MVAGQTTPYLDMVRAKMPSARIEIIPSVGHFPQLDEVVRERMRCLTASSPHCRLVEEAAAIPKRETQKGRPHRWKQTPLIAEPTVGRLLRLNCHSRSNPGRRFRRRPAVLPHRRFLLDWAVSSNFGHYGGTS